MNVEQLFEQMMDFDQLYERVMDYIYVVGAGVIALCLFVSWVWGKR